jgi:hypothetical protein
MSKQDLFAAALQYTDPAERATFLDQPGASEDRLTDANCGGNHGPGRVPSSHCPITLSCATQEFVMWPSARVSRRRRPQLELLEDRFVPSTVTNLDNAGMGSLRQAILDTPAGGTVDFQSDLSGTITLTSGELAISKSLTIAGPGPDAIAVSGNNASRAFDITGSPTVAISGLTIVDGSASGSGGAISVDGTLTISQCIISDNTASASGGGIFSNSGNLSIADSTLRTDHALNGDGGAVRTNGTSNTVTLVRVSFLANDSSSGDGGGGAVTVSGTLSITDCSFVGNSAQHANGNERGGAIWAGNMTISGSTFTGNTAGGFNAGTTGGYGGAIHADGTTSISNCTITGNTETGSSNFSGGGGLCIGFATTTITSCTITDNTDNSGYGGGGITNLFGYGVTLRNTIVAGNTSTNGPDIRGNVSSTDSVNNLIGIATSSYSGPGNGVQGNQVGSSTAPIDPKLGPLQDNGGPTETRALLIGSPALNAGDSNQLGVGDQRGVVRSGGVNIGAYQASASALFVSGPDTAIAGTPFDVTVEAVDTFGQTAVGYTGTVTFTSADPYGATVPADYHYTLADGGVHTFGTGATLYTAGNWDVTATDTATGSITGTATVTVNPAAADHLVFLQQATDAAAGQIITPAVMVAVVDQYWNVLTDDNTDTVTLAVGNNPSGGTLSGTLTVSVFNGIATFSDLSIDLAGNGYTLHASATGVTDADSDPFTITA